MTMGLTPRQTQVLDFIRERRDAGQLPPSISEICDAVGIKGRNNVHEILNGLEERGRIRRMPKRARAIEIIEKRCRHCGGAL